MLKSIKIITLALLLGTLPSLQAHGKGRGERGRDGFKAALEALNLTDEQKAKVKELRKDKKSFKEERAGMREAHEKLTQMLGSDASKDAILKQFDEIQAKRAKSHRARFEHMLAVREILTPEQRKSFLEKMPHRMHRGKGKGHGHGPGPEGDDEDDDL